MIFTDLFSGTDTVKENRNTRIVFQMLHLLIGWVLRRVISFERLNKFIHLFGDNIPKNKKGCVKEIRYKSHNYYNTLPNKRLFQTTYKSTKEVKNTFFLTKNIFHMFANNF